MPTTLKNSREVADSEYIDEQTPEKSTGKGKTKEVHKSLETKETTSSTFIEAKELGKSVEKKHQNRFLKWVTGGALGLLGISAGKELIGGKSAEKLVGESFDIFTDKEKLKKLNDTASQTGAQLIKSKEKLKEAEAILGVSLIGNLAAKKEKYRTKDYQVKNLIGDTWNNTRYKDKEKTQSRSWLGRVFTFIPALLFEYQYYRKIKQLEKSGALAKLDKIEKKAKEAKTEAKKIAKKAKNISENQRKALEQIRNNTALKEIRKSSAKDFIREYKNTISEATNNLQAGKISPKAYTKTLEGSTKEMFKSIKKNGLNKEFLELIQKKKVPGIEFSKELGGKIPRISVGAVGIANAINISILDAIRDGKFGTFTKSITSSQTLAEAFIPGVGVYHSIDRAWNGDDPIWLKSLDVGLNTLGDGLMAAGIIGGAFTGGASLAASYAAKGSLIAVARGLVTKQSLKYAAKKALKTGKSAAKISLLTSPLTIMLATIAKKIDSKKMQEAFTNNILNDEQQRSLQIAEGLKAVA